MSSGLLMAGIVVAAVALIVAVVLVRVLRRRTGGSRPSIGVPLPSGAVLNPSSADRSAVPSTFTAPEQPDLASPDQATRSSGGEHPVPQEVVRLVAAGRTVEAVAALTNATGRHESAWAERVVDSLSRIDLSGFVDEQIPEDKGSARTTSTTSISWSTSTTGNAPSPPTGTSVSSFSGTLPDEIVSLVQQGRTAEAEARIRSLFGVGSGQARALIETIAKLGL